MQATLVVAVVCVPVLFSAAWILHAEGERWTDVALDLSPAVVVTSLVAGLLAALTEAGLARIGAPMRLFTVGQRSLTGWVCGLGAMVGACVCGGLVAGVGGVGVGMVMSVISGLVPLVILACLLLPVRWLDVGGLDLLGR